MCDIVEHMEHELLRLIILGRLHRLLYLPQDLNLSSWYRAVLITSAKDHLSL
jgi:hypothetical protein